ncbi:hypothetical protein AGLY_002166 [Aphis glycines]|uniref:Uncharacterized protein n=1 Tax=Aphis glycines TaxID=307491 RepID=A0A6G0U563_APHGL|nr:hypothetical protein AGLY_002166 [Aphis glycines]
MASITVMLMIIPIIAITILTAQITNEIDLSTSTTPRELLFRCPSLIAAEYEVTVLNSVSALIAGCAYITYSSSILIQQSYLMWFGSKEERGQDCYNPSFISYTTKLSLSKHKKIHMLQRATNKISITVPIENYKLQNILYSNFNEYASHIYFSSNLKTINSLDLEYFRYNCLTKDLVLYKDTIEGLMYLRLYQDDYNKTGTPDYKCALYEAINGNRTSFRFAISPNTTCKGLIDVLYPPRDMLFSDSNPGAVLLSFNRKNVDNVDYERYRRQALPYKIDGNGGNGSVTNTTTTNINKN